MLWKKLMGRSVLSASVAGSGSNVGHLLAFAHCSQQTAGGLSVVFVNTDSSTNTTVDLSSSSVEMRGPRVE